MQGRVFGLIGSMYSGFLPPRDGGVRANDRPDTVCVDNGWLRRRVIVGGGVCWRKQSYGQRLGGTDLMILATDRLYLREMTQYDYPALCKILQDEDVMYAYEGAFSDAEVQKWLDRQIRNYAEFGFGLWAVILKKTNEMVGQCGLTLQPYNDKRLLEVGYLFQKAFWGKGYATEAAIACRGYAFTKLNATEVFSIIRDTNIASQNVAKRNGMSIVSTFIKHYRGIDMPHILFSVKAEAELGIGE